MSDRIIVITGASDGIGRAAAEALNGQPGTTLVLVGRNPAKIAEIGKRLGCENYACA